MPRIVVLDHTAELGGAELALVRLLEQLDRPPFEVTVILFSDGPLVGRLRGDGHRVEVLPLNSAVASVDRAAAAGPAGIRSAMATVPFVIRLARRLRAAEADVVHTTSLKADLLGLAAARLAGRPVVWHIHDRIAPDYLPGTMVRLVRLLARTLVSAVIANSHATAGTLPGARGLVVAHPGLTSHQIAEATPTSAPPTPIVGLVGRISPTKGQLEFVRAAAIVRRRVPTARFRIVGGSSFGHEAYQDEVRREIHRLGLNGAVELVGFVEDPVAEFDALRVAVHAATVPEPFGQVVAEAMARGIPVVATRGGGVDEIMTPAGETRPLGWTVPPRDPEALAEAIVEVLTNPDEARRRADAAWASVRERLTVEQTGAIVAGVWTRVSHE